ncbi:MULTISPECIES: hypothetical protein [unclassified Bacillus cereus group]|uniref:hypothetical protein n=1 Tax=unclassified Bacillus cereus group TaxID=2750818 RepID=UPI0022E0E1FE|nr:MULTISPECIES: hypothetical protein [unclassified Bacillus cereus group]MDA2218770.1 hypothetical protein [Bacillus cereus group sp. Bc228]MDA2230169.1 hypothetical protein [Bacillus cereus group sp. Bc227]
MREIYITNYESENILEGKGAHPYKLSDSETGYGQHLAWMKKWEEDRKQKKIERKEAEQEKKEEERANFLERFKKHPVPDEVLETLKLIRPSSYYRIQLVYILNNQLEIIAVVGKGKIGNWIFENGYGDKRPGSRIVLEHLHNKEPYDGKVYFVTFEEYEEFMRSKKSFTNVKIVS